MFKIIGFFMLVTAGMLSGCSISKSISERVNFLEQYLEFISTMETEIRYTYCQPSDIIKKYSGSGKFHLFLKNCSDYYCLGTPFPKAWKKSLEEYKKNLNLYNETYRLIKNFGEGLGSSDIDGQIAHCEYHKQTIKPYLQDELENKRNKSKMYGILGTCLGIIVGITII